VTLSPSCRHPAASNNLDYAAIVDKARYLPEEYTTASWIRVAKSFHALKEDGLPIVAKAKFCIEKLYTLHNVPYARSQRETVENAKQHIHNTSCCVYFVTWR
jgi:hypothetical protein